MSVSLSKGQTISLSKDSGLKQVRMGLGWDPVQKKKGFLGGLFGGGSDDIDLDASCMMIDKDKNVVDMIWFRQLASQDGSIQHSGDNRTGEGDGDDETIMVDLTRLPGNVNALVFTVNSFVGQTFDEVENAFCRLVDNTNDKEICRYVLAEKGAHTGVVMAALVRQDSGWEMKAVGTVITGRTVQDMVNPALAAL